MGFKPKPDSKNLLIRHLKVISYTGTVPMSKSLDIKAPPPQRKKLQPLDCCILQGPSQCFATFQGFQETSEVCLLLVFSTTR